MRAQAEGSPRAVAAVAPRSRVGAIYNVLRTAILVTEKQFNSTEVPCPICEESILHAEVRDQVSFPIQILRPPDEQSGPVRHTRGGIRRVNVT